MGTASLERVALKNVQSIAEVSPRRLFEWHSVRWVFSCALFLLAQVCYAAASQRSTVQQPAMIVVVGAPGETEFGSNFVKQASQWQKACSENCRPITIGIDEGKTNDYERLKQTIEAESKNGVAALWIIFIGHGTFDGKEARFNLRGPDLSANELALWLQPFHRPLAIINCSSSSAPFLNKLSATNRVLITATRSGYEQNFARFGQYFAETLLEPEADLDKDGTISLLESFLIASRKTAEFYKEERRLATEHALLDDNGDGMGTPADWFRGLRAVKKAKEDAAVDGLLAQQFHLKPAGGEQLLLGEDQARRDALERAVLLFREKKGQMPEDVYYNELEKLLLPLARFYQSHSNVLSEPLPPK
jgi:hypothetical protein